MTKQAREDLVKQMEKDYEDLHEILLTLGNFTENLVNSERTLPANLERDLQKAHEILDSCVGALYSVIPDPEDTHG